MPRPTTKTDLIKAASEQFEKMWQLIDSMTDDERNAVFNFDVTIKQKEAHWKRDKNLRDVFVHLYEWHQLLLNWITANQNDELKPFFMDRQFHAWQLLCFRDSQPLWLGDKKD